MTDNTLPGPQCSTCERDAHTFHNPLHAFLRITRPLHKPLPALSGILPILYDPSSSLRCDEPSLSTGSTRSGSSDGRPDGGLVLHQNVICDVCLEAISGAWIRCASCSASFDLCSGCLNSVDHARDHVMLKLTRRVDMALFRSLVRLSSNPVPLISFSLY